MPKYSIDEISKDEVTRLASLFFTPREVAIMLETDADEFVSLCEEPGHEIYDLFHAGRLQCETEVRTAIIKLAKSGSSPAQTMALDMINKSRLKMIDK